MVLRCLRAELMKCRRAPVWLAFLVLPLFPRYWAPSTTWATWRCWTPAGTACGPSTPCLPPCSSSSRPVRRVLRLAVAAGARRPQLERRPHRPGASACALPGQAAAGRGGVRPGHGPSSACSFSSAAGWQVSPPPAPGAALAGWPSASGLYGGVRRTALPQSGHPRLRPCR